MNVEVLESEDIIFPKRNSRFRLEDFFQTDVDDFRSGEFLFLSAKKVETRSSDILLEEVDSFDKYGWVISTYCYTYSTYYKFFICQYNQKPWKNHYHINSLLASLNKCDGYALNNSIDEFVDWMEVYQSYP